jgi:hypothetical protein
MIWGVLQEGLQQPLPADPASSPRAPLAFFWMVRQFWNAPVEVPTKVASVLRRNLLQRVQFLRADEVEDKLKRLVIAEVTRHVLKLVVAVLLRRTALAIFVLILILIVLIP